MKYCTTFSIFSEKIGISHCNFVNFFPYVDNKNNKYFINSIILISIKCFNINTLKKNVYSFGGIIYDVNTNNLITDNNKPIYVFDSVKNTWTTPVVTGTSVPTRRREMNVVMDNLGKMYIFGGLSDQYTSGVNSNVWLN